MGSLDTSQLTGAWSSTSIHTALNNTANRSQAEALGKGLFDHLFAPGTPIRDQWDGLPLAVRRLPLELAIADTDLRGYPWELIWDQADRRHARVGGLIRRAATNATSPPRTSDWPFRVAIIIGTDDAKAGAGQQIGADQEIGALRRALINQGRSIDLLKVMTPSRETLKEVLGRYQPHILHFIGHGTYQLGDKRYSLLIESAGGTWNWDTKSIVDDFTEADTIPRLVFLNCCRSADGLETASQATVNLQDTFTNRLGVGAVVAMQADVRGDLATAFSTGFYGHALAGPAAANLKLPSIAAAVQNGRKALGNDADVDWALPTLTLCRDVPSDTALFTRRQWPTEPPFLLCREFRDARVYADDSLPRRQMIHWVFPISATNGRQPNVLIVRGEPASGKSRLLHWCMESWATAARIRQLSVDLARGKNCLSWLIQMRAGSVDERAPAEERLLREPLDPAPFQKFYDEVSEAARLLDGPGKVDDPIARRTLIDAFTAAVTDDVSLGPLCKRFIEGMEELGRTILVFDQMSTSAIAPALLAPFRDAFLKPIGDRATDDLRVVLSVSSGDYEKFGLAGLGNDAARVVDVTADQSPEELESLAVESLRYGSEKLIRDAARATLAIPDDRYTGLGRLSFCQYFLKMKAFRDLERMQ